jgi:isopentenyl-diphosphate delta-isomerase
MIINPGDLVVLVDENDNEIGLMEKLQAHTVPALHRAVSVFIFNSRKQMLLQRLNENKYHSAGLWTNTACTHPYHGESNSVAAARRLYQEMGLESDLKEVFQFIYQAEVGMGLTEYEYDHVFIGLSDELPNPNPDEVCEYEYIDLDDLKERLQTDPYQFTAWFRKIMDEFSNHFLEISEIKSAI